MKLFNPFFIFVQKVMNNQIRKILALNEIGSVNQLLQKFDPKLGTNEGIGKYSYLTVESDTPKP
jgi:hypothetical protein